MNHLTDLQLNEYYDEVLDASARRDVDLHLASCVECRTRLEELQQVFSDLAELGEIKMPRDLTSSIMARLSQSTAPSPQKQPLTLTPFLAAQLGAVLGVFFWLSMQVTKLISTFSFEFPQFAMPTFQFAMPTFQPPDLYSLFSIFYSLFTLPHFPSSIFNLSTFQFSNIPTFDISNFNLALISLSIFILWLVGNISLLRDRSGVKK